MDFIKSFEKALITQDRWKLYLEGLGNTIIIALIAAIIGTVLGVLLAVLSVTLVFSGALEELMRYLADNVKIEVLQDRFEDIAVASELIIKGEIDFAMNKYSK